MSILPNPGVASKIESATASNIATAVPVNLRGAKSMFSFPSFPFPFLGILSEVYSRFTRTSAASYFSPALGVVANNHNSLTVLGLLTSCIPKLVFKILLFLVI